MSTLLLTGTLDMMQALLAQTVSASYSFVHRQPMNVIHTVYLVVARKNTLSHVRAQYISTTVVNSALRSIKVYQLKNTEFATYL
jgi:hypothetical protein